MSNSKAKENKNIRALFSVVCLCIIALGLVVYFSMQTGDDNVVDEQTTITVENTTQVQKPVTNVTETKKQTANVIRDSRYVLGSSAFSFFKTRAILLFIFLFFTRLQRATPSIYP